MSLIRLVWRLLFPATPQRKKRDWRERLEENPDAPVLIDWDDE